MSDPVDPSAAPSAAPSDDRITIVFGSGQNTVDPKTGKEKINPKVKDLTAFFGQFSNVNLICFDPDVEEIQTQNRKKLGSKKLRDTRQALVTNDTFLQKLRELPSFNPNLCFLLVEDTSLYINGKEFPGTFVKWFLALDAYKDELLKRSPDTDQARYFSSFTWGKLFGDDVSFLEAEVLGKLCSPEGVGMIDNQFIPQGCDIRIALMALAQRMMEHPRFIALRILMEALGLAL
jgi:inosine/xanthosine triphosphate pyrophosphatase family protein